MKLSEQEKAAHRAAFRNMSLRNKLDHVFTYYKWPVLLSLLALIVLGSAIHRQLTKKEPVLYIAMTNTAVGEDLEKHLTSDYLTVAELNPRKQEIYLYRDLYISEDADTLNHEYAYASKMKLSGAISAKKLDLVLMNREAYDLLSRSGYLAELSSSLFWDTPGLYDKLLPILTGNNVVLSDNSIEYLLGETENHEVETTRVQNALDVSSLPLFAQAGFSDDIYLGIVANSPRFDACLQFLAYLAAWKASDQNP